MLKTLKEIRENRGWNDSKMEKIIGNIHNRLKRRIPEDQELTLTAFQKKVLGDEGFWRDWSEDAEVRHLMIQGATSAGKTLLSELNILDTLNHRKQAIVLVPLKAMVHERTKQFREDMGHGYAEYDISVFGSSSDYMENDERLINGEYDVAIIVYEKFFAMLSQGSAKIMEKCGLLVVDELSMLSLDQRGPKLEMALEIVRGKYPDTRIMCLATCDCETTKVCQWLNIDKPIVSTARPVALEEHIIEHNGKGIYRCILKDHEITKEEEAPETCHEVIDIPGYNPNWRTYEKEQHLLLSVISKIYRDTPDARVLVFVSTQSKAARTAEFLKDNAKKWCPEDVLSEMSKLDEKFMEALRFCDRDEGQEKLIDDLIPAGIAYHHAGISTTLRELMEEQFSKPQSNLRVIVATETLTVGVNMPFDAMIMTSNLVPRGKGELVALTLQEYRNYIGRAGRLGQGKHVGKTYLFVENEGEQDKYWKSYFMRDEVESALTKADEGVLAPYYLSLLNNKVWNEDIIGNKLTLDHLTKLFDKSLSKMCGRRESINTEKLHDHLYDAYLASELKEIAAAAGAVGRKAINANVKQYGIDRFGIHMAPYALSLDTCIKIYFCFYEGYRGGGLPLGISKEDIESDRYLLDILYHVCRHKEIEESSCLIYPTDEHNVGRSFDAKTKVISQLKKILSETDEDENPIYNLWCDVYGEELKENNDIWRLLNHSNLDEENQKLQAAMRAVLLFYWTKGYTLKKIKDETGFGQFTKVINGDIERLAEVVSFHLDAICKSLSTAMDPVTNTGVYKDVEAAKAFYALQTRVKYGMPRELVVFANKHIHGLDRKRLLALKEAAQKAKLEPLQYLYIAPHGKIPDKVLTPSQQTQLKQAMERRGSVRSISTLMDIIEKDAGTSVTAEELECLRAIASWDKDDSADSENRSPDIIFNNLQVLRRNSALNGIQKFSTYGGVHKIIWKYGNVEIRLGVLGSPDLAPDILDFFRDDNDGMTVGCVLAVPHNYTSEQTAEAMKRCNVTAAIDNVYLAYILANTLRLGLDNGYALTEYLLDLKGSFTKSDYNHFPLTRYLQIEPSETPVKYRLICGNVVEEHSDSSLSMDALEALLSASAELNDYEILPWGRELLSGKFDLTQVPTVILLERNDIVRSDSLGKFIYKMSNQHFKNCILLLGSDTAEEEWNSTKKLEEYGQVCWSSQLNKIHKVIVDDNQTVHQKILDFVKSWRPEGYLIGISYAHYDCNPSEADAGHKNDVDKITALANKLMGLYGEHRILFDRFYPASKLFVENRSREVSLEAYGTCRAYLVLWNYWTKENINCQAECRVILDRCRDDSNYCLFLQTGHPMDPLELPSSDYYAERLTDDNMDRLVEIIKEELDRRL